ncbi:hypothetical protein [Chitinophaga rhizophila]|uniref:Uncharacterized protein n=1 Tax=Chitinophaga rhizophila TaxID=2866212 RepID=A0ABS7G734_9BACT|nr:hypothetical protein [Chitinophaga rhizophila]MBW8683455.1 hypothetical protein [Chitinophaga rhizophila]
MLYDYTFIESLVAEKFHPEAMMKQSPDDWASLLMDVKREVQSIKKLLIDNIFSFSNTQLAEAYVQLQQKEINGLLQKLITYHKSVEVDKQQVLSSFYVTSILDFESVMDFILIRFTQYFDCDQPATDTYRILACNELHMATEQLRKTTAEVSIDHTVIELLISSIELLDDADPTISYRQLKFANELISHVSVLLTADGLNTFNRFFGVISEQLSEVGVPESDLTIKLHMTLLYLNFNSREYVDLCTSALYYKMRGKSIKEKLAILNLYEKLMDQLHIKPDSKFLSHESSAVEQIKTWLAAEIKQLSLGINDDSGPIKISELLSEKIYTGLSSSEWAVITKVFKNPKVAVFVDENASKIYRVLSNALITKGTDQLSPEGLRSKANNVRPKAVENVMNIFFESYNLLRTGKF